MNNFNAGWYLLYTKPRHEKKISSRLAELSIDCFLPVRKSLRTWHDRKKYIDEPIFPSYLFIYLNDWQNYCHGMDVDGVLYYVKSGKEAARVNESIITNIRLLVESGTDVEVSSGNFQPGQQLLIKEGPLTGLSCEMIQINGRQKILVRVHLLQRSLLVTFPPQSLMPASACVPSLSEERP